MFDVCVKQDGYFSRTRLQCLGDGPPDFGGAMAWRARLDAGSAEKYGYKSGQVWNLFLVLLKMHAALTGSLWVFLRDA